MHYIVFDLEFNQDFSSLKENAPILTRYPFEILQIGAIKLDTNFTTLASFNRYVKPSLYTKLNPAVTELTGITTEQLRCEHPFSIVYKAFLEFIDGSDSIFLTWGMSDIKELYQNASFHQLDVSLLPTHYINLQPLASLHFHLPAKRLMRLQTTVEALNIPSTVQFHNALNDAYYTAKIWEKLYCETIQPQVYNPNSVVIKHRPPRKEKKLLNINKLIQQFEKTYHRSMTSEEQDIIYLAYHMGKTGQFQEVVTPTPEIEKRHS